MTVIGYLLSAAASGVSIVLPPGWPAIVLGVGASAVLARDPPLGPLPAGMIVILALPYDRAANNDLLRLTGIPLVRMTGRQRLVLSRIRDMDAGDSDLPPQRVAPDIGRRERERLARQPQHGVHPVRRGRRGSRSATAVTHGSPDSCHMVPRAP